MLERNYADVWEALAGTIPTATAVVQGTVRRSWAEFESRAARLAGAFAAVGVGHNAKVALYLYNGPEYLEAFFATLKLRAVPVNVNYRYLDEELAYLVDNADAEVLVFHSSLADRVERVAPASPKLKLLLRVDDTPDGAGVGESYEDAISSHDPAPRIPRSGDDILMVYTGGTTGMPKGVMSSVGSGVDTYRTTVPAVLGLPPVETTDGIVLAAQQLIDEDRPWSALPACPLMHGTGMGIGALPALTFGGTVVLLEGRGLDVDELWSTVERHAVNSITVVGDAFARPMLRGLREGPVRQLDSVRLILSAGAMFSAEVKDGLLEFMPGAAIIDYIAATEGAMGYSVSMKGAPAATGRFMPNPGVKVFAEDGTEVTPGSRESGIVAVPGSIPEGYYHDDEKTARTFKVIDGVRYSLPGDWATVDADGSIVLLGRGSQCINTGGEKVFPEEVEEILKLHPSVEDALVFGVPDERFGQRVVGVASLSPGAAPVEPSEIVDAARVKLSSYKLPRALVLVDVVPRAANGKADYPGAKAIFEASLSAASSSTSAAASAGSPPQAGQ
jgi:acyl-CoA synthetase (AMP-forming)/AMP-acid ligase II